MASCDPSVVWGFESRFSPKCVLNRVVMTSDLIALSAGVLLPTSVVRGGISFLTLLVTSASAQALPRANPRQRHSQRRREPVLPNGILMRGGFPHLHRIRTVLQHPLPLRNWAVVSDSQHLHLHVRPARGQLANGEVRSGPK